MIVNPLGSNPVPPTKLYLTETPESGMPGTTVEPAMSSREKGGQCNTGVVTSEKWALHHAGHI